MCINFCLALFYKGFTGGSGGKESTGNARDWDSSPGQEDPLEKGMATHSSLAWKIPWTEEPGGLQSMGSQRVRLDLATQRQERQWNQDVINYYGREGVIGQGTSVGGLVDLRDHMVFLNSEGISPWNHFMAFSLIPHTSKQNS